MKADESRAGQKGSEGGPAKKSSNWAAVLFLAVLIFIGIVIVSCATKQITSDIAAQTGAQAAIAAEQTQRALAESQARAQINADREAERTARLQSFLATIAALTVVSNKSSSIIMDGAKGLITLAAYAVVGFLLWKKRKEL